MSEVEIQHRNYRVIAVSNIRQGGECTIKLIDSVGDLGLVAEVVEENLSRIFYLAEQWDCVLLLDEADVFLAERTKSDLKRNSLVSGELKLSKKLKAIDKLC